MMQHFDIDVLLEYGVTQFPDTEKVVNPTWRQLNRSRNSLQNKLRYRRARFAEMTMHPETEDKPAANRALAQLLEHLNKAEVNYPGTDMRLVYQLGGYTASNDAKGVT